MTTQHPTPTAEDIVIVGAARTPQGKLKGQLSSFSASDLGAIAIQGALTQSGVSPEQVDYLIMGQVVLAGAGQNPARQAARKAGLPWNMPSEIVNKVCLSGLTAINNAARMLRLGEVKLIIAGGQESMTNAPHLLLGSRFGWSYGSFEAVDSLNHDALIDSFDEVTMGCLTDQHVAPLGITREEQDEFSYQSHHRAAAATEAGVFRAEIAPVTIPQRKGDPVVMTADEGIRADTTVEGLARLKPAFVIDGTITAGSASQLSDGAAAVVLTTRSYAETLGLTVLATLGAAGQVAGPDNSLPSQPSNAIKQALAKQQWESSDLDLVEINEAFAAVGIQSTKDLGLDSERVNVHGGGIAVGHPVGASGARLVVHLAHQLAERGSGSKAAAALCGGGGQGEALLLWN